MDKEQLAEEIRSRIEKSLSRLDYAGKEIGKTKEEDVLPECSFIDNAFPGQS